MPKELISVDQAASIKKVSTSTIYAWIGRRDNPLKSLRVDAYTLIDRADLDRFKQPNRGRKAKEVRRKVISQVVRAVTRQLKPA
jgi:hypothetical protein